MKESHLEKQLVISITINLPGVHGQAIRIEYQMQIKHFCHRNFSTTSVHEKNGFGAGRFWRFLPTPNLPLGGKVKNVMAPPCMPYICMVNKKMNRFFEEFYFF